MPSLTVRNIPKDVYKRLKQSARRNHHSLNAEVVGILGDEDGWIGRRLEIAAVLPELDRARQELAGKYGQLRDSVNLIRENRASR